MGIVEGRVAIVTGAGRGIGREHALALAREGARVVVNDLGVRLDGTGGDDGPAGEVVEEIRALGGEAVADGNDVTRWDGAHALVERAREAFGDLHVLVNNAGILRDRMFVNMAEAEWDAVIAVHLKGHFCATRAAVGHWRERAKAGLPVVASVINTSSSSGLYPDSVGQANYSAAKAGIAALSVLLSHELGRYGIRVNALAPAARTRMTEDIAATAELVAAPDGPGAFDAYHPANSSPLVVALAAESCGLTGEVFHVVGGTVHRLAGWHPVEVLKREERWDPGDLLGELGKLEG